MPRRSILTCVVVCVTHVLVGLRIAQLSALGHPVPLPPRLTMVFLAPETRPAQSLNVPVYLLPIALAPLELRRPGPIEPESDGAAHPDRKTVPPHPEATATVDTKSFARQAGLHENSGVTVVLRVEVRGTGAVGRVEVDVSGGSRRIDQAAVAYIRSLKWIGGRVDDEPETLWIRWGVRLNG